MSKIVVVVFDSERQAYTGYSALKELHGEGSITLYASSVLAKDGSGKVSVKEAAGGPLGTAVGVLTGMLVGLPAGPIGVAIGATTGTMVGVPFDLAFSGVNEEFLQQVAESLQPGKAAVVAEMEEEWVTPVDARMEALGGTVIRRTRREVESALFDRDIDALDADIRAMEAAYEQASGEAKAKLQARIDAARAKQQQLRDQAKARAEATQREAEAKVATLKEQAAHARADQQAKLDQRKIDVQAEYAERSAKLAKAQQLRKEAWELTREAVAP